jgi:DNA polymerase sigma
VHAHAAAVILLGDLFSREGFEDLLPLPRARVPIVKFTMPADTSDGDTDTGGGGGGVGGGGDDKKKRRLLPPLHCDIGINNLLAVENSRLLRDYAVVDGRFRALAYIVKHWSSARRINDP